MDTVEPALIAELLNRYINFAKDSLQEGFCHQSYHEGLSKTIQALFKFVLEKDLLSLSFPEPLVKFCTEHGDINTLPETKRIKLINILQKQDLSDKDRLAFYNAAKRDIAGLDVQRFDELRALFSHLNDDEPLTQEELGIQSRMDDYNRFLKMSQLANIELNYSGEASHHWYVTDKDLASYVESLNEGIEILQPNQSSQ